MLKDAERIHREAIVIDATCPLAAVDQTNLYINKWKEGGVTVIAPTISFERPMSETIKEIAEWIQKLHRDSDLLLQIMSVSDIYKAKKENKVGILFAFQDTVPLNDDLNMVEFYQKLGLRIIQLCYNRKNSVGDGCSERVDSGLTNFGEKVIEEMNRCGIVVDLSHTGYRTTMEAIEVSRKPVIFSHSNVKAIHDSERNLSDDQIKAVALKRGVIGMNGFPAFVAKNPRPHLTDLLNHVDYIARLVGTDYISIGMDYFQGMAGVASDEEVKVGYEGLIKAGIWDPKVYPAPPWHYPEGVEMPDKMSNLTAALLSRGYSEEDVKRILGENLIRVFKEVWV